MRRNTETIPTNPVAERAARERLSELWEVSDKPAFYPASDRDVLELATVGGYTIDAERLESLLDRGLLTGVAIDSGRRRWTAADIMTLFALLEVLREYNPKSNLHRAKLTATEIQYHEARAAGQEPFPDLAGHSVEMLLAYLAQSQDFAVRVGIWLALTEKLGIGGRADG